MYTHRSTTSIIIINVYEKTNRAYEQNRMVYNKTGGPSKSNNNHKTNKKSTNCMVAVYIVFSGKPLKVLYAAI